MNRLLNWMMSFNDAHFDGPCNLTMFSCKVTIMNVPQTNAETNEQEIVVAGIPAGAITELIDM